MSNSIFEKRLFFAFEVNAPWPDHLPQGRILESTNRHLTAAFLGKADYSKLEPLLQKLPSPPFQIGLTGEFDDIIFLPKKHPHVAAYHVTWFNDPLLLKKYCEHLTDWLKTQGFPPEAHQEFLPHVTICRTPFDAQIWSKTFHKLPMTVINFHLYESKGNLHYEPLWTYSFLLPFEEIEHTADVAFKIRGESICHIYINALIALAFKSPEMMQFKNSQITVQTIDDIVIELNRIISQTDSVYGCSYKAVSYHGQIIEETNGILTWEMIVDV